MSIARVLIVAGSDSGGAAGIQADLKAVAALGGHGMTAITALTAQNTLGVSGVHSVPLDFVREQFQAVVDDIGLDVIKTGMLHSAELVELAAQLIHNAAVPAVVDPVMAAESGARLLDGEAVPALKELLVPKAALVTPNLDEAQALTSSPVRNRQEMAAAARALVKMGAGAALVKGGHLEGQPGDLLFDGKEEYFFSAPRIESNNTHGTGCTLASGCATLLAQGWGLKDAVARARLLVRRAIAGGLDLGEGAGPVNAMADLAPRLELGPCVDQMQQAIDRLERVEGLAGIIPEIRGQIGYALPGAARPDEVLAVAGRITHIGSYLKAAGSPRRGASTHVAKIVLTAYGADATKRAAMALVFDEALIEKARSLGWSVGEFSRADEPGDVKAREGSTLEWGTAKVIAEMGLVPQAIFDRGEVGKEPVLRIIAENPGQLVDMVLALADKEKAS